MLDTYLKKSGRCISLLLSAMHIISGQPARASELQTYKICNTTSGPRSLYLSHRKFFSQSHCSFVFFLFFLWKGELKSTHTLIQKLSCVCKDIAKHKTWWGMESTSRDFSHKNWVGFYFNTSRRFDLWKFCSCKFCIQVRRASKQRWNSKIFYSAKMEKGCRLNPYAIPLHHPWPSTVSTWELGLTDMLRFTSPGTTWNFHPWFKIPTLICRLVTQP